jgi:hypothetical protein
MRIGEIVSSLLEFAMAVLVNWRTAIAAVVFAMFSFPNAVLSDKKRAEFDRKWPAEDRRKWLLRVSIAYIFVSCFLAWNEQHSKVIWIAECASQEHRCLTDEQKVKLKTEFAKLKPLTSYVVISYTNGDSESGPYMQDFADAIRRAGLEPRYGFTSQDNPDQVGVIIALKDPKSPPPETEPLRTALRAVGIEPKVLGFPSAGFSVSGPVTFKPDLVLWVAERPL